MTTGVYASDMSFSISDSTVEGTYGIGGPWNMVYRWLALVWNLRENDDLPAQTPAAVHFR